MTNQLQKLLDNLHNDIHQKLTTVRESIPHPGSKGKGSENIWMNLFQEYLPKRYKTNSAFIVDSNGDLSDQIDIVIFDQQYSPFIFHDHGQMFIPAESVYAVFESKQTINADHINYAQKKVASVRKLYRTSLKIPHAGGTHDSKPLTPIIGGILTLESGWRPPLGKQMKISLEKGDSKDRLNIGCVAGHGYFFCNDQDDIYQIKNCDKAVTAFLFNLISRLQLHGTVPMIDLQAYSQWLEN